MHALASGGYATRAAVRTSPSWCCGMYTLYSLYCTCSSHLAAAAAAAAAAAVVAFGAEEWARLT